MLLIRNEKLIKVITLGFATGITLYPFVIFRGKLTPGLLRHEKIHVRQQVEMLILPFYALYFLEWVFKGYRNISFEREAFANQYNASYLQTRKPFSFIRYFRKRN